MVVIGGVKDVRGVSKGEGGVHIMRICVQESIGDGTYFSSVTFAFGWKFKIN